MTTFAETFWGEKNNGFFVLYTNMKHGQTTVKELSEYLRETITVEENYSKLLNRLTKNITNASNTGTFSPFWSVWKAFIEKLSTLHLQMVHTCSDLLKDMARYNEEQHKKHKAIKENEHPTLEAVQAIQSTLTALHKAKELYHTRCLERERLKRENASPREQEKAEQKCKKSQDEYRSLVDKYQTVKATFEKKMADACQHFQEVEEEHICQMKDFIDTYVKAWENQHALLGQVQQEFKVNCDQLTVHKLISTFIQAKSTGSEKPGPIEFVEPDLSSLPAPSTRPMSPELGVTDNKRDSFTDKQKSGFLKNKTKRKEKKAKKKKDKDNESSIDAESQGDGPDAPQVDEEGYCIRPENPLDNNEDKTSYSTDSDSDSDDDGRRKIKVAIRPLSPTNQAAPSSNVEDIRASLQGLSLSPTAVRKRSHTPVDKKLMKRSQSESDTLDKPNQNLLSLDLLSSSAASTPTGPNYSLASPLSPSTEINWNMPSQSTSSSNDFTDLFSMTNGSTSSSNGGLPGSTTPTPTLSISSLPTPTSQLTSPTSSTSTGLPGPAPARPPSRTRGIMPQTVKPLNGPSSAAQNGSVSSSPLPVSTSRGPSPLTVGVADSIPLAVAFTDTINAFFKGTDTARCTVRVSGVLHMSFPVGVLKVFTENPSPPTLSFRLKNTTLLQTVDSCELVVRDESQGTPDSAVYNFDMAALKEHLRKQGEQNKTAYYNVEVLRYQIKAKPGVDSTPLPLAVQCKSEENSLDWRLDYRYNAAAMSSAATIKNVAVVLGLPPDAQVTKMHSVPVNGKWDPDTRRASWRLNDISDVSEQETQGYVRAKFEMCEGPIKPQTTMLQFGAEGANLSGCDFELVGPGYRVSLTKKRFCTGKYYAEAESSVSLV